MSEEEAEEEVEEEEGKVTRREGEKEGMRAYVEERQGVARRKGPE